MDSFVNNHKRIWVRIYAYFSPVLIYTTDIVKSGSTRTHILKPKEKLINQILCVEYNCMHDPT